MTSASTQTPIPSSDAEAAPAKASGSGAPESLGERATRASVISLGSYILAQVLRLAGNVMLTRMLFEQAFGLMALVNVFINGIQLFSDFGIGQSLIQSKRGEEPAFQDTAWTVQVLRGTALWAITCAGAWPFAVLYNAPDLMLMLPVTGLTALISGFNSTKLFTLNRRLSMTRLAVVELVSQTAAIIAMFVWGTMNPTVWVLVCGAVTVNLTNMVLSHVVLPGRRNWFHWEKSSVQELARFGGWIIISTALSFLAAQSDRLVFGKLVTLKVLGVYNIAQMAASMPIGALGRLAGTVVFPVLSRTFERGENVDQSFRDVRKPLLLVGGYLISGAIAGGPIIIQLLYDDRFIAAGWMLRLLAIGSWFGFLEYSIMSGLLAAGLTRWIATGAGARLCAIIVMIPLGYYLGGFKGALIGYAVTDLVRLTVSIIGAREMGVRNWTQDMQMTVVVAVSSLAGAFAALEVAKMVKPGLLGEIAEAGSVFVTVSLLWLPFALGYLRTWLAKRKAATAAVPA